jgi:hypothetical protein
LGECQVFGPGLAVGQRVTKRRVGDPTATNPHRECQDFRKGVKRVKAMTADPAIASPM